jgi:OOP family OmpA-OmpF porin
MKLELTLFTLALAASVLPAAAQTDTKVLVGKDLNESALIDALTPPKKMRSFKLDQSPAKPPSASLLITFPTNSAELTAQAKQSLDIVGRALSADKLVPFKFSIEGHADPRGGSDSNLHLSEQRAEAVRQYLVQNHYVEGDRLRSVGKGDTEPLNEMNPAAPENRRVTIVTITK